MLVPPYEAVGKSNEAQETSVMVIRTFEYILTKHWLTFLAFDIKPASCNDLVCILDFLKFLSLLVSFDQITVLCFKQYRLLRFKSTLFYE